MCIFHKFKEIDKQDKWSYQECVKCNKRRTVEIIKGGYQIKKHPNWDKNKGD